MSRDEEQVEILRKMADYSYDALQSFQKKYDLTPAEAVIGVNAAVGWLTGVLSKDEGHNFDMENPEPFQVAFMVMAAFSLGLAFLTQPISNDIHDLLKDLAIREKFKEKEK